MTGFDVKKPKPQPEKPPSADLGVDYPGGAPALRRDELMMGRYPAAVELTGDE